MTFLLVVSASERGEKIHGSFINVIMCPDNIQDYILGPKKVDILKIAKRSFGKSDKVAKSNFFFKNNQELSFTLNRSESCWGVKNFKQ